MTRKELLKEIEEHIAFNEGPYSWYGDAAIDIVAFLEREGFIAIKTDKVLDFFSKT